MHRNVWINL